MPMDTPFQRVGSISNSHVGRDFELVAQECFARQDVHLQLCHAVPVGIGAKQKLHAFDLGCSDQRVLVECKSHRWTAGHNIPSAKLTVWNVPCQAPRNSMRASSSLPILSIFPPGSYTCCRTGGVSRKTRPSDLAGARITPRLRRTRAKAARAPHRNVMRRNIQG